MDKYRYYIYPDRIYVIEIAPKIKIEIRGWELMERLGLQSYMEDN